MRAKTSRIAGCDVNDVPLELTSEDEGHLIEAARVGIPDRLSGIELGCAADRSRLHAAE
jgi:hypothetical protein